MKHEDIYLNDYATPRQLRDGIRAYITKYNHVRPHQSLENRQPAQVFWDCFAA